MKYAAVIDNVHEVTILGSAKLNFWREYLKNYYFYPFAENRKTVIIISAIKSKYKGIRFSELSVSLKISSVQNGKNNDGFYMLQAYNSNRFFTIVEQKYFKTPYIHGKIILNDIIPPKIKLIAEDITLLEIEMGDNKTLNGVKHEQDEFNILLPGNFEKNCFKANLEGQTFSFDFSSNDKLLIHDNAGGVWNMLRESGFKPLIWKIRNNAIHRKSKTFKI